MAACGAHGSATGQAAVVPADSVRFMQDTLGGSPPMRVNVAMYDAPLPHALHAQVNLALLGVGLVTGSDVRPVVAYKTARIVDLLTLKHTPFALEGLLQAGHYDAVRLFVDTHASNVTIDGRVYPMIFRARGHRRVESVLSFDARVAIVGGAGDTLPVTLDFNVLESISIRGGFAYVQPHLRVAHRAAQVNGVVVNADGMPVSDATVVAYDRDGNVANTTLTEEDGSFTLHALAAGHYRIAVRNAYVSEAGESVVSSGASSDAGPSIDVVVAPLERLDVGTLRD
ncbi:MAG: hypothetical protein NVS3B7_05210 [Candidatus Elarobacter sp.]